MADATLGCMVDITLVLPMADVDVGAIDVDVPMADVDVPVADVDVGTIVLLTIYVDVPVGCMQAVSMIGVYVAAYVYDPAVYVIVGCMVDVDPSVDPSVYVIANSVDPYVRVVVGCMVDVYVVVYVDMLIGYVLDPNIKSSVYVYVGVDCVQVVTVGCMQDVSMIGVYVAAYVYDPSV